MTPRNSDHTALKLLNLFTTFVATRIAVSAFAVVLSTVAAAQSRQIPAPPQSQPVLIHGATVHTVTGDVIDNGYVLFADGVITDVGSGMPSPSEHARRIDASGLHVYPGLIASSTNLGLVETGSVDVTHDYNEYGRIKPEVRAAVAINPDSDLIPVARANGILLACVFPSGGLISGRCSTVRLDGWTWEQMAVDDTAGLVVNWPRTEPVTAWWMQRSEAQQRREIEEDLESVERFFDEAEAYLESRRNNEELETDLRFEAMRDALEGRQPIFVNASSAGQIESAVAWANRRGYDIVIVGGREADQVAGLLREYDVPVIITGLHHLPGRRHYDPAQPFELPRNLHQAGVKFCIASGAGAAHERNLNHNVATAAAYGLPKIEALRAVTINAADILGLGDTYGSIEPDKSATLIVTTGDPLEITTDTLMAFIDGRDIDLGSRHKALYHKYREKYKQLGLIKDD